MPFGSDTPDPLRLALAAEPAPGEHPPPEELIAFRDGALSGSEAERLRDHLAGCEDCAIEMLELEALQSGAAAPEVSAAEIKAAWRRQRRRVLEPLIERSRARPGFWWILSLGPGLAALVLAVVSVGLWRRIEKLERPRANPPIVQLLPAGALRAATPDEVPRVDLGDEPRLLLVLNPRTDLDLPAYTLEAFDPAGRSVFRLEGVKPSKGGSFSLEVARDALPFGRSRIVIFRPRDRRSLETFEVDRVGRER